MARVINKTQRKMKPATDPESREEQLIFLATNLAEKQLREGTASSSTINHFLKLGCIKEQMEKEKLQNEIEQLKAKTEALRSAKRIDELYEKAILSMKEYKGEDDEESAE